jgi:hypothetical protein
MTNDLALPPQLADADVLNLPRLEPEDITRMFEVLAAMHRPDALAIGTALMFYDQIGQDLRTLLAGFIEEREFSESMERLLFWGVHLMGAARDEAAFPDVLSLLSLKFDRIDLLLGDAITTTLPKILAGTFNGDHEALMAFIEQPEVDGFVRSSAMEALAFLTFDGRIDMATTEDFLRRIYEHRPFEATGIVAWSWSLACALLGLDSMAPLVESAYADGVMDGQISDYVGWTKILADAHERPTDVARFHDEAVGYFDDLYADMKWIADPEAGDEADESLDWAEGWQPPPEPVRNPLRNVGRNDPCPCGSGKKYKKCCLNNP